MTVDVHQEMEAMIGPSTDEDKGGIPGVPKEMEAAFTIFSNTVYKNLIIWLENRISALESRFKEWDAAKLNITTLSTLLAHKGMFTKEEFSECFQQMAESFGQVRRDGTMTGKVVVTKYNFKKEN